MENITLIIMNKFIPGFILGYLLAIAIFAFFKKEPKQKEIVKIQKERDTIIKTIRVNSVKTVYKADSIMVNLKKAPVSVIIPADTNEVVLYIKNYKDEE